MDLLKGILGSCVGHGGLKIDIEHVLEMLGNANNITIINHTKWLVPVRPALSILVKLIFLKAKADKTLNKTEVPLS